MEKGPLYSEGIEAAVRRLAMPTNNDIPDWRITGLAGPMQLRLVFEDFLRKVWRSGIEFQKLDIAKPQLIPIGPGMVVGDDIGFVSAT